MVGFGATWHGLPLIYSGQEIANTKRLRFFDKDAIDWKQSFVMEPFSILTGIEKNQ